MKQIQKYLNDFDPFKQNERYVPEDRATLQYARIVVIADGKWVGAALYPCCMETEEVCSNSFVQKVCRDYVWAQEVEIRLECFEHITGEEKRELADGEFSLFCLGALDLKEKTTKRFLMKDGAIRTLKDQERKTEGGDH